VTSSQPSNHLSTAKTALTHCAYRAVKTLKPESSNLTPRGTRCGYHFESKSWNAKFSIHTRTRKLTLLVVVCTVGAPVCTLVVICDLFASRDRWLGGRVVRALDLQSTGRTCDSRRLRLWAATVDWKFVTSVNKIRRKSRILLNFFKFVNIVKVVLSHH